MIGLDTNVILGFLVRSEKNHTEVSKWFNQTKEAMGTTHTNIAECLRLLTHPKVFPKPLPLIDGIELLEIMVDHLKLTILEESPDWWRELGEIAEDISGLKGNEIFDARIALCLRYNGAKEICTYDSDFSKYRFLKIIRPKR
jgi:predicted nucleic acid-binding protein